jgi:phenylacetate-CoA ligase
MSLMQQPRPDVFPAGTEDRVLAAFHRAANAVPFYRALLRARGVRAEAVRDMASFLRCCPVLDKSTTFDRVPLDTLSVGGRLPDLSEVLTSSGRGGRFSFGVSTRAESAANVRFLDDAFDAAFQVRSRSTLAINCLPMGVGFSSHCMTVATTSVREDMAVALVQTFGHHYDQILLVGDPLFMKRLTDHAREKAVDWRRYRVHVILGEEIFGEHYRRYLAGCLGVDPGRPEAGYIMSSFGVGELGLHLAYETRATIAVRQAAAVNPGFAREVFGAALDHGAVLPTLFTFDPLRVLPEILEPDDDGYGLLTTSMLDEARTIPLLRYQAGDVAALVDYTRVADLAAQHGVVLPDPLPMALLALRGRSSEALPNGSHVGVYKDALYADPDVADRVTGALRLVFEDARCTLHVQLAPSAVEDARLLHVIEAAVPLAARPANVVLWPYARFPYGMTLDYERKFSYYQPGDAGTRPGAPQLPEPALELLGPVDI